MKMIMTAVGYSAVIPLMDRTVLDNVNGDMYIAKHTAGTRLAQPKGIPTLSL